MRAVASFAGHVLRAALGGEVGTHVLEDGDGLAGIVAGCALRVVVGKSETGYMCGISDVCRIGVMTTVTGKSAGKGRLCVTCRSGQAFIRGGNARNDGTSCADVAAFTGYAAGSPVCNRQRPDVAGITGSKGYVLGAIRMVGRVNSVTGFT